MAYIPKPAVLLLLSCIAFFASCAHNHRKVVAVSQCSMDEWRDQMNEEMRREAFFHTELDVEYHSTADNSEQQIRDIESFIKRRVDLIVVAPNEERALTPVIERAYDAGIPVVQIDRKARTNKYTAYVGGDNIEVGREAARYIVSQLPQGGNIIEIEGLESSSASQERKVGLHEILDSHTDIHIVSRVVADWKRDVARHVFDSIGARLTTTPVDIVFAYNDRMAIGAHESYDAHKRRIIASDPNCASTFNGGRDTDPLFIGVDALMNDSVGVGRIEDGTLTASFLYPTGGDKAIHTAACILNGQPFDREQILQTSIVNKANVHLMRLQASHIAEQDDKIEFLNDKLDTYFKQYSAQKALLYTIIVVTVVILILLVVSVRAYIVKHRLNLCLHQQTTQLEQQKSLLQTQKEQLCQQRDELSNQKETLERQRDELEAERDKLLEAQMAGITTCKIDADVPAVTSDGTGAAPTWHETDPDADPFLQRFNAVLAANLDNSDITVDMLGAEMNLGRTQLYRRIKSLTGMTPNEMLRLARLTKAYHLLRDTDLTVSEVGYAVGFSSPSYFAKCYKDHFGVNPSGKKTS